MRRIMKSLGRLGMMIVLWNTAVAAHATEVQLCEPFKSTNVDQGLINTMLGAVDSGGLYRIDKTTSQMGFCIGRSALGEVRGTFGTFHGGLALLPQVNPAQALVLIESGSLHTDSSFIDVLAKSESFFDVQRYPEILFVSREFKWTGDRTAELSGDLTMRGTTRPVTFHMEFDHTPGSTGKILVKANTVINRKDFGMTGFSPVLGSEVKLCLQVAAERITST